MNIRRIFITIAAVMLTSAVFADSASVTSKKYVDDLMTGYQNKIPGSGTNKLMIYDSNESDGINQKAIVSELGSSTSAANVPNVGAVLDGLGGKQETFNGTAGYVMTGMGTNRPGEIGERAIYSANTNYSNALVTAETVNTGVINAVNSSLRRVNEDGDLDPNGTLWEINTSLFALDVRLPLRYRQVEWLRSTKGLIITGFKTKDTQTIKSKWMRVSNYAQYVYFSDAASSGTTNTTAYVTGTSSSGGNWRFGGAAQPLSVSSNVLYETVQNKNGVWVNDVQTVEYEDVSSFTSSNDLNILGAASTSPIRLYSLQIEENGIKTLDIIPVQDVTENTYGVYDLVNGIFYTNAEATFTAGPTCVSPNLFDANKATAGYVISISNGAASVSANNFASDYIAVTGGKDYTLNKTTQTATNGLAWYDSNKTYISGRKYDSQGGQTFTAPQNAAYVRFSIYYNIDNVQFEEGSTATTYSPYGQNICD